MLVVAEDGLRAGDIAGALHERTRPSEPLVSLNCSAVAPAELVAALFGGMDGDDSADLMSLGPESTLLRARAGTLFLENIDDLPASAQRRLVRVLRDGEVRVGQAPAPVPVACRIVASTTRSLEAEVRDGRFRQDLLKRFHDCTMTVPPLRQRPEDLASIVDGVVAGQGKSPRAFTQPALTMLAALPWQRNIDELSSILVKALQHAGPTVRQEDVLAHLPMDGAFARFDLTASLRDARRRFEREYIAAVLERHQWRMSDAARTLGIERANLYRKTRQLGIARSPRTEIS